MNEKKECKIVQDLLPNYIENLTSIQTNEYIEEHIANCKECKGNLENMQKEVLTDTKGKNKKEVKYMKKYRNKMRILSFILLAIFSVFIGTTIRKAVVLANLAQKAEETVKSTNYHMTIYSYNRGRAWVHEEFILNGKRKVKLVQYQEHGTSILQSFIYQTEGGEVKENIYMDGQGEKKAILGRTIDTQNEYVGAEMRPLRTENIIHLLCNAVITSVQSKLLNGTECYLVTNFKGLHTGNYGGGVYINKENGLVMGSTEYEVDYGDGIKRKAIGREIEYEFGTITEEDFIEPDISKYQIQK